MGIQLNSQTQANVRIIQLSGRLDAHNAKDLNQQIQQIIEQDNLPVLFDLSELIYISSSGLGILLTASDATRKAHRRFGLCGLTEYIEQMFRTTQLAQLFTIYKTREGAIIELSASHG